RPAADVFILCPPRLYAFVVPLIFRLLLEYTPKEIAKATGSRRCITKKPGWISRAFLKKRNLKGYL
ncbi:hypothetical protein, partial [Alcanivorax sp. HI0044]|uniref:hypothetical protein n=1 Tax=Alcanivorax sp. HI0044 TaxID=1822234 RepID=UPI001E4E9B82